MVSTKSPAKAASPKKAARATATGKGVTKRPAAKPAKSPRAAAADGAAAEGEGSREFKLDAKTTSALTASLKRRPKSASPAAGSKAESARKRNAPLPGCVVYVGHLPHGFYEEQLRPFFEQFGTVRRLRVARARNSAKPKGYAFVEFEDAEVARIVANAMHNYIMFDKLLKVHVMAAEDVHPQIFRGAEKKFKPLPTKQQAMARTNRERSDEEQATRVRKLLAAERRQKRKLADAGIDYEFSGYAGGAAGAASGAGAGAGASKAAKGAGGGKVAEQPAAKAGAKAPKEAARPAKRQKADGARDAAADEPKAAAKAGPKSAATPAAAARPKAARKAPAAAMKQQQRRAK